MLSEREHAIIWKPGGPVSTSTVARYITPVEVLELILYGFVIERLGKEVAIDEVLTDIDYTWSLYKPGIRIALLTPEIRTDHVWILLQHDMIEVDVARSTPVAALPRYTTWKMTDYGLDFLCRDDTTNDPAELVRIL